VTALTLDRHIPASLRGGFGDEATFCLNPDCGVVYCNPEGKVIRRHETVLPVTIKDPGDDVYVCYCFEHTRGEIRKDLLEKGRTEIPDQIKKKVQTGLCDCERKNPQGACCLGNVHAAMKAIQQEVDPTNLKSHARQVLAGTRTGKPRTPEVRYKAFIKTA
jgi:hypothetical protein